MGEVYQARDVKLLRDVAVKILPGTPATDAVRVARFQQEARILASLNHPHIAQIYGFDHANGLSFLALELVEGESLAEKIRRGPLKQSDAVELTRQIAEALDAAHERGIIHRDLKPANVMITRAGAVKLLDFGVAKVLAASDDAAETIAAETRAGSLISRKRRRGSLVRQWRKEQRGRSRRNSAQRARLASSSGNSDFDLMTVIATSRSRDLSHIVVSSGLLAAGPHRPEAQDVALSRPKHGFESRWGRHLLRYAQSVTSQRSSGSAATRFARRQRYRIPLGTSRPAVDAPARGNGYNLNRSDFSRPLPSQTSKR